MSRKEKVVFGLINLILFILVIVFLNDRVISMTSDKVAPILAVLLFINLIIALNKGKGGKKIMKLNWKEKTMGDKVITILGLVCSSLVIILSSLQLTGVWEKGNNVVGPLMCVALLLQAIREWKEQRIIAIFSLCVAIFIFVIAFIIFVGI